MTEMQQLIAMLQNSHTDFEITDGTYVHVGSSLFIFHINGQLKEHWSNYEMEGC